jgi:hypothetical protein
MVDEHGSDERQPEKEGNPNQATRSPAAKLPDDSGNQVGTPKGAERPSDAKRLLVEVVKHDTLTGFEKRMFWLTVAGVLLAVTTGVIFYREFQEMSKQTGILNRQAATAHNDSVEAIKRAGEQVEMARQTMRIDQRAWIGITASDWTLQPPLPLAVGLKLQQLGKTPARNCIFVATVETANDESHVVFDFKKGDAVNRADLKTILPNAIMNLKVSEPGKKTARGLLLKPLTQSRFDAINRGGIQFFVHGKLTYDDAFAVHHWVEFCFVFEPNRALRTGQNLQFVNCQRHNDIDDNLE